MSSLKVKHCSHFTISSNRTQVLNLDSLILVEGKRPSLTNTCIYNEKVNLISKSHMNSKKVYTNGIQAK
jgi:hypothetical protein